MLIYGCLERGYNLYIFMKFCLILRNLLDRACAENRNYRSNVKECAMAVDFKEFHSYYS